VDGEDERQQWRLVVEETKAHPGLWRREDGWNKSLLLHLVGFFFMHINDARSYKYQISPSFVVSYTLVVFTLLMSETEKYTMRKYHGLL
jgi:hypothetical protein